MYYVWWINQNDCESIGGRLNDGFPEYIRRQYRSRYGRPGRARLWIDDEITDDVSVDPWANTSLAKSLDTHGGIVIRASDKRFVDQLPGVITDTNLIRI